MPSLTTAASIVTRDRSWWRNMLIGGALTLSVVGYPLVEGYQIESIENTRQGFPTPLPLWNDLGTKAVQGIFALVIDFFYIAFPLLGGAFLFVCGSLALAMSGAGGLVLRGIANVMGALLLLWLLVVWLSSVLPIAKRLYVNEGQPNQALTPGKALRVAWEAPARAIYLKARLQSLPLYLPPLGLIAAAWWSLHWSIWLALICVWLAAAALLYAHLVVVQLYDAAAREVEQRKFEAFQARLRG